MFRRFINNRVTLELARRVLPVRLRQTVGTMVLPAPSEEHFSTLLRDRAAGEAVAGRVILVCGSLQPGGAERQVANTLVGLARVLGSQNLTLLCDHLRAGAAEQYDFYLPLARQSQAIIREVRKDAIAKYPLPASFEQVSKQLHPGLVADVAALYSEFRMLRPEVVHAWLDWSNVRAGLAAVLAGVPRVLLSGRNLSPRHFALNTNYYHSAYRALSACPRDQVIWLNNSEAGANDYADWLSLPAEHIRVIRNGVDFPDEMRPTPERCAELRKRWRVPPHALLTGGMFRFNEEKRPLLWIEAAARIARALPDAHFVIFGQGPMRAEMERLIRKHGIEERVHMLGLVTPSLDGLAPCDLVLLASRGEGTPNVLLEAQWLGIPVVTVEAGGAGEAVNHGVTGLVVQSDSDADIADAALSILRDDTFRRRASEQGAAFISQRYGMERMIEETAASYGLADKFRFNREMVGS